MAGASGALALVVLGAIVTWVLTTSRAAPARTVHVTIGPQPADRFQETGGVGGSNPLAEGRPTNSAVAISADGERVAFLAAKGGDAAAIYVSHLDPHGATLVAGTAGAVSPVFSPDGRSIAFWKDGAWMKVSVDNAGQPIKLCEAGPPFGASWGADDAIVFAEEWGPLREVPASGGAPRTLTDVPPGRMESHRLPHVLPDGRGVLFTVLDYQPFSIADWGKARVEVLVGRTGQRKLLLEDAVDARYVASGHLLYARRGALEAAPFDLASLKVTGGAGGVLPDVMQSLNCGNTTCETGAAQIDVSQGGTVVYLAGGFPPLPDMFDFVWADRSGRTISAGVPPGPYWGASLSPDGKRLAYRGAGTKPGLWVWDFERSIAQNVTTDASHRWPLWTRDGRQLVHSAYEGGGWTLVLRDLEGSATPRVLGAGYGPASWSRDGRTLVFTDAGKPGTRGLIEESDIWTARFDGASVTLEPWLATPDNEDHPALSPDGRWLAYTLAKRPDAAPLSFDVYVEAFPGHSSPRQVSAGSGCCPLWSPDQTELAFVAPCQRDQAQFCVYACSVRAGTSIEFGRPRELIDVARAAAFTVPLSSYDTVDGQRFIMLHWTVIDTPPLPAPREVHVVLNWFEELKAKVPTR